MVKMKFKMNKCPIKDLGARAGRTEMCYFETLFHHAGCILDMDQSFDVSNYILGLL